MVVALAVAHLLSGIAAIIRANVARYSFVHFAWVVVLFFSCVDYWFSTWRLSSADGWSLAFVLYLLILATFLYISCYLIMPAERDGEKIDLVIFHDTNRRWYLGAYFIYVVFAISANMAISGFEDVVFINIASALLIASAWTWRSERVQVAAVVAQIAINGYYAVKFIPSL